MVSPPRMRGCAARQRDPAAGARTAGVAPDEVADHDPPLSLHRLWACVAPGHQPGRRAAGEAVASRAAMGARSHRVAALDRRSGRRGPRRVVDHRQRRGAGRGQACVDRGPTPVRRRARDRRRRALLAPHPPRRYVRHRDHRPHADPGRHRSSAAAGYGRGPIEAGVEGLAWRARHVLARRHRGGWNGRVHRFSRPPPARNCPTRSR